MTFKCNGCDHPITPPRLFAPEQSFKCKTCGMKYTQHIVREITKD